MLRGFRHRVAPMLLLGMGLMVAMSIPAAAGTAAPAAIRLLPQDVTTVPPDSTTPPTITDPPVTTPAPASTDQAPPTTVGQTTVATASPVATTTAAPPPTTPSPSTGTTTYIPDPPTTVATEPTNLDSPPTASDVLGTGSPASVSQQNATSTSAASGSRTKRRSTEKFATTTRATLPKSKVTVTVAKTVPAKGPRVSYVEPSGTALVSADAATRADAIPPIAGGMIPASTSVSVIDVIATGLWNPVSWGLFLVLMCGFVVVHRVERKIGDG